MISLDNMCYTVAFRDVSCIGTLQIDITFHLYIDMRNVLTYAVGHSSTDYVRIQAQQMHHTINTMHTDICSIACVLLFSCDF